MFTNSTAFSTDSCVGAPNSFVGHPLNASAATLFAMMPLSVLLPGLRSSDILSLNSCGLFLRMSLAKVTTVSITCFCLSYLKLLFVCACVSLAGIIIL